MNKFKCVKQHETIDCGAAVLATICLHYGLEKSLSKVRDMCGTDLKGTNLLGLVTAAEKVNLSASAVKVTEDLYSLDLELPVIAHVINNRGMGHSQNRKE